MSLNVLVVDDCDLVRKMIARTLSLARIPVLRLEEAANGRDAFELIRSGWFDIVLADLNMPVMDGVRMIELLFAEGLLKTVPVVVISTEGSLTRIEDLTRMGVAAYIRKPFTPEELRDIVWKVAGRPDLADYGAQLNDVVCEVVERFALMVGAPLPENAQNEAMSSEWVQAKLSFRGRVSGTLATAAPRQLMREIAANALGFEPDDVHSAESAPDALKEFANLLCGRLVAAVAGEQEIIELSAPVLSATVPGDWAECDGRTIVGFDVEGHRAAVALTARRCTA